MADIRIIGDLAAAASVWRSLSPRESVYDLWEFRSCFHAHDPHELRFYAAYAEGRPIALLPLQYNEEFVCLEFFAENFLEDNRPFFAPGYEHLLPELYAADFGRPVKIFDLTGDDPFTAALPLEDHVYYLNLGGIDSFDAYLRAYFHDRKKRAKFRRVASALEEECRVATVFDDFTDLPLILDLNALQFGAESYLRSERERRPFYDLLKLPLEWRAVTVIIDGRKVAASLSVLYRGTYYYMIAGADRRAHPDVFKYLTRVNLERAIAAGADIFNASLGDCNWKSHWHMERRPQYKFIA